MQQHAKGCPPAPNLSERKDDMRRRGLASPDDGDALALPRLSGGQARLGRGALQAIAAACGSAWPPYLCNALVGAALDRQGVSDYPPVVRRSVRSV
jgi:hypothetical protein